MTPSRKLERFELRLAPEMKDAYEQAARMDGKSITAWITDILDMEASKAFWRARRLEIARSKQSSTESDAG